MAPPKRFPAAKAPAGPGPTAAHAGAGPVASTVRKHGYTLEFHVRPNRVGVSNRFSVRVLRGGRPVHGLDVTLSFAMLDMAMPGLAYTLPERGGGVYARSEPALVMGGHWGLTFGFRPPHGAPFSVLLRVKTQG